MNDQQTHRMFKAGVLLKGAHATIECVSGLALALLSTDMIVRLVNRLTQEELIENRADFVATHLLAWAHGFSVETKDFYAFYLLSHGIVKLALVAALLRNKLWAYPLSLVVLGAFIAYQLYRYSYTHGVGLLVLTVLDAIVMVLIWQEYSVVKRHLRPA